MKTLKTFVFVLSVTIAASAAQAAIFIDFDGGDAPTPDSAGIFWAGTSGLGGTVTNAVDENNVTTTVDIVSTDDWEGAGTFGVTPSPLTGWDAPVTNDALFITGSNTAAFNIEGLDAGGLYELTFYGSRVGSGFRQTDVTIDGNTQSYSFDAGEDWTVFSVNANGSGEIAVSFAVGAGAGILGALKISAIPEPSSLMLVGFGLAGAAIRRRRSK